MKARLLGSFLLLLAAGCATRDPATTWGYSEWYGREGPSSMGTFKERQRECLERIGASADPASIKPESSQESAFIECMNDSGWCSQMYRCDKPGA